MAQGEIGRLEDFPLFFLGLYSTFQYLNQRALNHIQNGIALWVGLWAPLLDILQMTIHRCCDNAWIESAFTELVKVTGDTSLLTRQIVCTQAFAFEGIEERFANLFHIAFGSFLQLA